MAHIRDLWYSNTPDGRVPRDKHGKGRRWKVIYTDDAGKAHYPTFAKKVEAERFKSTVEADLLRGTYINPDKGQKWFREYAGEWQKAQVQHAAGTAETVQSDLNNHILPHFGDRRIGAIRKSHVQPWVTERSTVLAPRTMHRVYKLLATIMRAAVADELIGRTPCVGVNLPTVTKTRVNPLPVLAVEALIGAAPDRWRAAFILAPGSGMREGEILGLTLDRIAFLTRRIEVNRQLRCPTRGKPALAPVKTAASERTLPQADTVLNVLSEHVRQFPPDLVTVDEYTDRAATAKPREASVRLLFVDTSGAPIRRGRFIDTIWKPTVVRAEADLRNRSRDSQLSGLKDEAAALDAAADRLAGKVDFHELRHFYASLLIAQGENVKVVQARLGHKSATETLDTYGHLWPDSEDATRSAVEAVLGSVLSAVTAQGRPEVAQ